MITYLATLEQVTKDAYFNDSIKLTELRDKVINDISQFIVAKSIVANMSHIIKIQSIN